MRFELLPVQRIIVDHLQKVDNALVYAVATKSANEARLISALQMLESFRSK